ncbi:Thyrotropin-releasing hormone receptor [Meloidogyne graminicola]|uniref:Thyrotropin-releasing hormone receptor n=1 Tax=Meloidogyne graminicola TaxID=189291 RepID=A0A8T0A6E9_9BILA|nr:Thyrotropin-releasing hormone receptor [Meloidogyne graminicola]
MSIMSFTIERFIGICYPLRARYICTVKRAKLIILFIWCFSILYNSPWFYLATLKEIEGVVDGKECSFRLSRDNWTYKVVFMADFLTFYVLPMFLYIYLYGKIAYTLTKCEWIIGTGSATSRINNNNNSRQNKHFQNGTNTSINSKSSFKLSERPSNNNQNILESQNSNGFRRASTTTTKSKLQVIKMLALVAFIFAVCWLPYRAMVMYNSFASAINWEVWDFDWLIYMSKTMIFFNCAINPVLYNLMSSRFRKAFRLLIGGQKRHINVYKRGSAYLRDQNQKTNGDEGTELVTGDIRFSNLSILRKQNECINK